MQKRAFTLVELIVVITILAILGTIAFLSFQGYSKDARDSTRVTDVGNIETSLELFLQVSGKLPVPDNKTDITFSGSVAWYQGVFGDTNTTNVDKLNEKPTDPITGGEYAYSTTAYGNEYELATILESGLTDNSKLLTSNQTTATGTQIAAAYVVGNYNQKFLRTRVSNLDYVLAVPSIIASDINDATLEGILTNGHLVYKGYNNLPSNYSNTTFSTNPTPGFEYTNTSPVVYTGSLNDLTETSNQTTFVTNLQNAYSGSVLTSKSEYKEIIDVNINSHDQLNDLIGFYSSNNFAGIPDLKIKNSSSSDYVSTSCYDTLTQQELNDLNQYVEYDFFAGIPSNRTKEEWCSATYANFSGSNLTEVPSGLYKIKDLIFVIISNNDNISDLGSGIGNLTNISTLNISGMDGLTNIPSEVGNIISLDTLYIDSNPLITSIPSSIGNLINLTTFTLDNNSLTSLPSEVCSLLSSKGWSSPSSGGSYIDSPQSGGNINLCP